ncbi:2OG-Fe(II) oxygenase [Streptomyces sp. NPDC087849]|uniref:2OG-Fe(II) oxygenase n=1 Tax=Streptomyces sp. NPDC087849 TaxID=3365808 RepID=UPI0037F2710D
MLNTQAEFEHITDPFAIHLAQNALAAESVKSLYENAPRDGYKRVVVSDPNHDKQYAMNLLSLQKGGDKISAVTDSLSPQWKQLLQELRGDQFVSWLERGTGIKLRHLATEIGIYIHDPGDFISVHKDKTDKALTAILYLTPYWPEDGGGQYEVRNSPDPADEPARRISPRAGQFLAFPPSEKSWHSVSEVTASDEVKRVTVQLEFWLEGGGKRSD